MLLTLVMSLRSLTVSRLTCPLSNAAGKKIIVYVLANASTQTPSEVLQNVYRCKLEKRYLSL